MRTITQRTTLPFLIAESGAASLTLAVITSPSPARSPRSPPLGRMQDSFRAPLLSATSRIVRIPIIRNSFLTRRRGDAEKYKERTLKVCFPPRLRASASNWSSLNFHVQVRRFHGHLSCAADHFHQPPALQFAERAALHDPHHVPHPGRALLVV